MILVSAGHHPRDPGACNGAFYEFDEAVRWVTLICRQIPSFVPCLRVPPGTVSEKIRWVNRQQNPTLLCEVHFNSNVKARGSETLYCPGSKRGFRLATLMQGELEAVFPPGRGVKEGWYRQDRPGVKDFSNDVDGDEFVVSILKKTKCPAIIIEPEFISNREVIESRRFQGCDAVARALCAAYGEFANGT